MSESYNFDIKTKTKRFTVQVDTAASYGWFEHDRLGDTCGGGLWFEGKELVDADGYWCVPDEVADCLVELGFIVDSAFRP